MSEHIGKRLAEINSYGVFDRGEIVGETEKTWVINNGYGGSFRTLKNNKQIPTTAENYAAAVKRIKTYSEEIRRLETQLSAVRAERRAAVEAALRGEEERNGK